MASNQEEERESTCLMITDNLTLMANIQKTHPRHGIKYNIIAYCIHKEVDLLPQARS